MKSSTPHSGGARSDRGSLESAVTAKPLFHTLLAALPHPWPVINRITLLDNSRFYSNNDVQYYYRLLDPLLTRQCDEYRRVYADILYAWDLLDKRSEVLKYQVGRLAQNSQAKLRSICHQCGQLVKGPSCKDSHCFAFTCSICNLSVRGEYLRYLHPPPCGSAVFPLFNMPHRVITKIQHRTKLNMRLLNH